MFSLLTEEKSTAIKPQSVRTRGDRVAAACTLGFLVVVSFLTMYQLQPPRAVPASAPPDEFSAQRALEHLKVIAQKPHPTGSAENQAVRAYLLNQLSSLGLNPQVQVATVVRYEAKWRGPAVAATVYNVVARLKGTQDSKAVMLAAHYDSVSSGPGASDDGSGVATLLETVRALKSGKPLANDVIFLFTDGEELGLLGAQAFVDHHPWAKDVGVVLNFEARGACGPVTMFETSPHNGRLIAEFAKDAPHAVASSLMYEAYKLLPNDTDLSVFKQAGMPGLNFAYVGCWPRYHTIGDNLENLSPRSLQHDGSYALALARGFGNMDLTNLAAPDAVYFSLFDKTIEYSQRWVLVLVAVALLSLLSVVMLGINRGRLSARALLFGIVLWPLAAFASSLVPEILWVVLRRTRFVSLLPYGMAYNGELYALGFLALAASLFCAIYLWASGKTEVANLTAGVLVWWGLLAALSGMLAPGASYALVWPLLAALVALGYELFFIRVPSEPARALVWALPAAVAILVFGQVPYLLLQLLSATGLVVLEIALALMLGFLWPNLQVMASRKKWVLPAAGFLLSIALIIWAMSTAGYDARHPRADDVFYLQNAETGNAYWASTDAAPDSWTAQFLSRPTGSRTLRQYLPFNLPILTSAAPAAALAPPVVKELGDVTLGNERFLRLDIASQRQARALWVSVPAGEVLEGTVEGIPVPIDASLAHKGTWGLVYVGPPESGFTLVLHLKASQPVIVRVADQSDGLPEFAGTTFKERPPAYMPAPGSFDSSTIVSKTFAFKSHSEGH
jgi:hypothetical protein